MLLPVIDQLVVDFVRHNRHVGPLFHAGDELVDFGLGCDAPGGVGGRVDDDQSCPRRDQRQGFFRRKRKAVFLADRDRHGCGAGIFDHRAVNREAGVGIHDFHPGFAEHQDGHEHGRLAARHNHYFVRRHLGTKTLVQIGGHRLAQHRDTGGGCIAVMAIPDRLDGGFGDVVRGPEVGLTDAQIDDVAPLGGQGIGTGQDGEGVFLADPVKIRDSLHGLFRAFFRVLRIPASRRPR